MTYVKRVEKHFFRHLAIYSIISAFLGFATLVLVNEEAGAFDVVFASFVGIGLMSYVMFVIAYIISPIFDAFKHYSGDKMPSWLDLPYVLKPLGLIFGFIVVGKWVGRTVAEFYILGYVLAMYLPEICRETYIRKLPDNSSIGMRDPLLKTWVS